MPAGSVPEKQNQPQSQNESVRPHPVPAAGLPAAAAISVVRGNPSAADIAALVAVLAARRQPAASRAAGPAARSGWSSRSALLREPLAPGPGSWRASALPR